MIAKIYLVFSIIYYVGQYHCFFLPKVDPEVYLNITEIILRNGYPCEDHTVVTEDGYILSMQRISNGRNSNETLEGKKPVVFLQHGLLDSAHTWVNNLPYQSLGFILADKGFDVWLGNVRGTTYSKKHIHLDPGKLEYWKFSWDEMAEFDMPACIYYILKATNSSKISYVGHSQGTEIAFAAFTQNLELASHISSFSALGPVITVKHIAWAPYFTVKSITKLAPIFNVVNHGEFFQNSKFLQFLASKLCVKQPLQAICSNAIFWLTGFDVGNLNNSRLPIIIAHTPAGTSIQNIVHYDQGHSSGNFQKFDYGSKGNQQKYGQKTPPLYNVTKLNVPLALYWGGKDYLSNPTDVKNLIPLVYKTLKRDKFIPYYNHMDYVWGIDAHKVIYPDLIEFIQSEIKE